MTTRHLARMGAGGRGSRGRASLNQKSSRILAICMALDARKVQSPILTDMVNPLNEHRAAYCGVNTSTGLPVLKTNRASWESIYEQG